MMSYANEVQTKLASVRALMAAQGVGVLWLRRVDNVSWITGGVDTAVNIADATGIASVVITPASATMWTTTIEAPRLQSRRRRDRARFRAARVPLGTGDAGGHRRDAGRRFPAAGRQRPDQRDSPSARAASPGRDRAFPRAGEGVRRRDERRHRAHQTRHDRMADQRGAGRRSPQPHGHADRGPDRHRRAHSPGPPPAAAR